MESVVVSFTRYAMAIAPVFYRKRNAKKFSR
jgi:hypothetical protein